MEANKICTADGTWVTQSDYNTCSTADIYRKRHNIHVDVLYVSTAIMIPSIIIFLTLRKLRVLRVMLHLNLIIMIIIKNILTMVSLNFVILDALKPLNETANVLVNSYAPCKALTLIQSIFENAIYTSMFLDGFYLHKMIVRTFAPDPNIYVLTGAIIGKSKIFLLKINNIFL